MQWRHVWIISRGNYHCAVVITMVPGKKEFWNLGCNLVVVGPLLDGFISRIGKEFTNKRALSKLTGIQHLPSMFFIWQTFIRFVRGYGGVVTTLSKGKKTKNIITTFLSIRKIWHPYWLNNVNSSLSSLPDL